MQEWLWETWRFVKQIFPLLIVGVFAVGVIRPLIRPEWIESLAGSNTLGANVVGVLFGVFMYFPTLVEVPIARLFLDLGMHRGPLLAYLMADPELSLQSILIIASVIGRRKAWVYVGWVALFSTLAGLALRRVGGRRQPVADRRRHGRGPGRARPGPQPAGGYGRQASGDRRQVTGGR